jgi:predicted dehydrogenase
MAAALHIPVIGSGSIGRRHHRNLLALGAESELLSYRENGRSSVETLLARAGAGADGVVIATGTHIRNELISLCAGLNVPMYIEKPVAFTAAQVEAIYSDCAPELQQRSVAGYMMRYHPLFRWLCEQDLTDTYRFNLTIGHDVLQWRDNWRFSESYASQAEGGGVLLDLCHELDMAQQLLPSLTITRVQCLGHSDFDGVDFSTEVMLQRDSGAAGSVCLDYLSPASTRSAIFFGLNAVTQVDFNRLSFVRDTGDGAQPTVLQFDRNDMFIAVMKDFIQLIKGQSVAAWCPTLDRVKHSAALIAEAWQQRQFTGYLSHPLS